MSKMIKKFWRMIIPKMKPIAEINKPGPISPPEPPSISADDETVTISYLGYRRLLNQAIALQSAKCALKQWEKLQSHAFFFDDKKLMEESFRKFVTELKRIMEV